MLDQVNASGFEGMNKKAHHPWCKGHRICIFNRQTHPCSANYVDESLLVCET